MDQDNYKRILAYYLRTLRLMNGKSQLDIAKKLNKTTNAVSNWELGNTSPPIDDLMELCKMYGVSPNQMFGVDPIPQLDSYVQKRDMFIEEYNALEKQKQELMKQQEEIKKKMRQIAPDRKGRRRN